MLEKLVIKNFQRHKSLTIKFDKNVTYITGPNDSGKSAIFRMAKWICLNKRPRSKFVHWGTKWASGTLHIDGRCLRRKFDGRSHSYFLDGESYQAVGTQGIPADIEKLLSLSIINFQDHRDHTFWFGLSPSNLSKELNRLVDLESIDRVQSDLAKRVRKEKSEIEVVEKRLATAEKKVKELKSITRIDNKLGKLEKMGQYRLESARIDQLRLLIGARVVQRARIGSAAVGQAVAGLAGAAGSHGRRIGDRARKLRQIVAITDRSMKVKDILLPDPKELESLLAAANKLRVNHRELSELINLSEQKRKELCQCRKKLSRRKAKLEKKLGGRCPRCGGILTDQSPV